MTSRANAPLDDGIEARSELIQKLFVVWLTRLRIAQCQRERVRMIRYLLELLMHSLHLLCYDKDAL